MDLKSAINVWEFRRIDNANMPRNELFAEIEEFIKARSNCAMATGSGTYVRNTPMRYVYKDRKFFLITEGGYKFKALSVNPHMCLAIYDSFDMGSDTHGLTIEGSAEVSEFTAGVDASKLSSAIAPKFLITFTPKTFDYLNSDLPARGFYQLQRYVVEA